MNDRTHHETTSTDPPPPAESRDPDKAGMGLRILGILLAFVIAFGAAVMIVAAGEIADTPTEEEVTSGEEPLPADGEVYDGSESERSITTVLGYASGGVGALAFLLGIAFLVTGRRGGMFLGAVVLAVVLAGVALLI